MSDRAVRMLFIGNSFTTRNNLPGMVCNFAAGMEISVQFEVISAGGASLRRHLNAGAADRIRGENWDYVVLQEQSTLPVKNRKRFHENVRELAPAAMESGANLVLYMTWARKGEPENQRLLTDGYNEIAKELGAAVVPAGDAWQLMLADHDTPALHADDGSHPTAAGTYLAAYTFYLTLFGTKPVRLDAASIGLTEEEQDLLQRFAMEACAAAKANH